MIFLIVFLILVVALVAWGAMLDRKRRRRAGLNVSAAARAAKLEAERRSTEWGAGM